MDPDAKFPSKDRVERNGYLVYAEGDDIPEWDKAELQRQGYVKKGEKKAAVPAENKKAPAGENKSAPVPAKKAAKKV